MRQILRHSAQRGREMGSLMTTLMRRGNGEQAASEDSSEAEQDDVGAAGDIAQKEIDMQVQGLPFHRGGLCPCHASHCLCFLRTRCMSAGPHYVQPYPAVLQCDCGPHLTTVFLLGARSS